MTAVTVTPSANNVPKADAAGKIAAGWIDSGLFYDSSFRVVNLSDTTKKFAVQAANQATATTVTLDTGTQTASRSFSLPQVAADDTLMVLGTAQTITGLKITTLLSANTVSPVQVEDYRATSSGTPGAGFGTSCSWRANSASGTLRALAEFIPTWAVATDASRTVLAQWYLYDFNGAREVMRWNADGTDGYATFPGTKEATSVSAANLISAGGLGVAKRSFLGTIGGTFKGNVLAGVQDATAAVSGQVGEKIESTISSPQNAAATGVYLALTSISLTAGDWIISGWVESIPNGSVITVDAATELVIGTTSASNTGSTAGYDRATENHAVAAGTRHQIIVPAKRVNISATTSFYANVLATFTVGTPTFIGSLSATRVR